LRQLWIVECTNSMIYFLLNYYIQTLLIVHKYWFSLQQALHILANNSIYMFWLIIFHKVCSISEAIYLSNIYVMKYQGMYCIFVRMCSLHSSLWLWFIVARDFDHVLIFMNFLQGSTQKCKGYRLVNIDKINFESPSLNVRYTNIVGYEP
jgi:hypothetical protein